MDWYEIANLTKTTPYRYTADYLYVLGRLNLSDMYFTTTILEVHLFFERLDVHAA